MATKRPDRTTMAGMIWNANHVLERALDPSTNGIPRKLFEQDLQGILLISVVEAGFIFSGNVGSGILMARREGKWSPPCAVGLTGVGWGFIVGASLRDVMVLIFDEATVSSIAGDVGIKFGGQASLTLGPFGRDADLALALSNKGAGATVSISFSKGIFGGISVEGGVVAPRSAVNEQFYGKMLTPLQILTEEEEVKIPDGSLMPEVYAKLDKLVVGDTHETTPEEEEKVESARLEAEELGKEAAKSDDVVEVDAKAEAAKAAES